MEDVPAPAAAAAESKEAAAADDGAAAASDSAAAAETKAAPKEKKPRAPRAPKVKAPAAAASSVDAAAAAGTSSRGRERKGLQRTHAWNVLEIQIGSASAALQLDILLTSLPCCLFSPTAVQHFAPESIKKEEIEFIVEEGPGTKLGEIENIKRKMDATNAQDTCSNTCTLGQQRDSIGHSARCCKVASSLTVPFASVCLCAALKCLFAACFPEQKGGNTKLVIKKHIREFSGYPKANASDLKESASTKIERYDGATLKAVCQILDISESGTKAKHIERITEFLESPESSGKAYSGGHVATSGSKRKSGSSTKGKDGKVREGNAAEQHVVGFQVAR